MKTACVLSCLLASAAAFAPSSINQRSTSSLAASEFENEAGVLQPTGYWDPAKLSNSGVGVLFLNLGGPAKQDDVEGTLLLKGKSGLQIP